MNESAFNSVSDADSFEWWSDIRFFPEAGLLPRLLAGQKTCLYVLWVQISVAMAKKPFLWMYSAWVRTGGGGGGCNSPQRL